MKLFFWYISLNPHFFPLVEALACREDVDEVYLLIPELVESNRKLFDWNDKIPSQSKINIVLSPTDDYIDKLYSKANDADCYHFYAGIRGFDFVYNAFSRGLRFRNLKRGIITEPPYVYKKPIILHYFRYYLFDYKYRKYIDYYFTIGDLAYKYYNSIYPKWKIIPFWYVTSQPKEFAKHVRRKVVKLVYVGAITSRKNVLNLVKSIASFEKEKIQLDIIGDGDLKEFAQNLARARKLDNINFLGAHALDETRQMMVNYDALILPSKHDGWGATVNEGLMRGVYCMASTKCGSSNVLTDSRLGFVFKPTVDGIKESISYLINNIEEIRDTIEYRIDEAKKISPEFSAEYFVSKLID